MRIQTIGALALAACLSVVSVVAYGQKVNTDSDPSARFGSYKTYAWTVGTPSPNPLGEQRIHAAIDSQLTAKGLRLDKERPDLVLATHVTSREEKELIANGYGYGGWWYGGGGITTAHIETYLQGTLVVDIYDAMTKKMIWRGTATDTVSDKAAKNTKKINKAVAKMFERYPASAAAN